MLRRIKCLGFNVRSFLYLRSRQICCFFLAVLVAFVSSLFALSFKVVLINDGRAIKKLYTLKSDISTILLNAGYQDDYDLVGATENGNRLSIEVTPFFEVTVTREKESISFNTTKCTVREAIEKSGLTLGEKDFVNFELDRVIEKNAYIDIVPYKEPKKKTKPVNLSAMNVMGDVNVAYGEGGVISTLSPDFEIELDENGLPVNYTSVVKVQATAYTYTGNRCSTGVYPQPGYIAVNPKVIPYGTKMYIVSADGRYKYGYAVAADTGGFISKRPTNVDLFMASQAACVAFGRRDVYIYFITE